jgi:nucleoside-diphosphate-sugar epimerase
MKYFITGATGFIGGRIVRQLAESGHEVVAIARDPKRAQDLVDMGVDVRPGDITDRESMRAPMTGVDGVFHVAAWYKLGERDKSQAEPINVGGTRNVLELMRDLDIPKGVYTSSLAVHSDTRGHIVDETYEYVGPFLSEYDRTKWIAHYEVAVPMMRAGLPLVIAMPGVVYGPGDTSVIHDTFERYLQRRLPAVPSRTAYCWGYVGDTARGHILAMERGSVGASYQICGPIHTLVEAMIIAQQITGIPAPRFHLNPIAAKALAELMSLIGAAIPLPPAYSGEGLRSSAGVTYIGSNEKAKRELGFTARPLEEGLRETLTYEMERLHITS